MLSPPDGPVLTPSVGDANANVGRSVAATLGPTGMNTLLDVNPMNTSGFLGSAARNASSCDDALTPPAGMRSYLTVQPFFSRSFTASFAPSSKFGTASDDSPFVSYAPMTYSDFFAPCAPAVPPVTRAVTNAPTTKQAAITNLSFKAVPPCMSREVHGPSASAFRLMCAFPECLSDYARSAGVKPLNVTAAARPFG